MAQKFNVEILVHHLRVGDEMYKKGQVVTFPTDVIKQVGNSVKILVEIPDVKVQRTTSNPTSPSASNASTAPLASSASTATSTKKEEKITQTDEKK